MIRGAIAMVAARGARRGRSPASTSAKRSCLSRARRPVRPASGARPVAHRRRRLRHRHRGPATSVDERPDHRSSSSRMTRRWPRPSSATSTARGHEVAVAGSVEEAEQQLDAGLRPEVVLLDINLPDEAGWALLRGPALAAAGSPPVVMVTATRLEPSAACANTASPGTCPSPSPWRRCHDHRPVDLPRGGAAHMTDLIIASSAPHACCLRGLSGPVRPGASDEPPRAARRRWPPSSCSSTCSGRCCARKTSSMPSNDFVTLIVLALAILLVTPAWVAISRRSWRASGPS